MKDDDASNDLTTAYAIFFEGTREATASPEFVTAMQGLKNPRHADFVRNYLRTADGTNSARAAGYAHEHAAVESCRLLKRGDVRRAIDASRSTLAEGAIYDQARAMAEALAGIQFALETGNANALARLIEHRAKLNGLLVERFEVATVDITAALADARSRTITHQPLEITLEEKYDA